MRDARFRRLGTLSSVAALVGWSFASPRLSGTWRVTLQAVTFGLFHIADARATGEPVVATVLVTAIGGWLFGWLADRSGSLAAPMLAHLAINEAGAIAALTVRRSQQ